MIKEIMLASALTFNNVAVSSVSPVFDNTTIMDQTTRNEIVNASQVNRQFITEWNISTINVEDYNDGSTYIVNLYCDVYTNDDLNCFIYTYYCYDDSIGEYYDLVLNGDSNIKQLVITYEEYLDLGENVYDGTYYVNGIINNDLCGVILNDYSTDNVLEYYSYFYSVPFPFVDWINVSFEPLINVNCNMYAFDWYLQRFEGNDALIQDLEDEIISLRGQLEVAEYQRDEYYRQYVWYESEYERILELYQNLVNSNEPLYAEINQLKTQLQETQAQLSSTTILYNEAVSNYENLTAEYDELEQKFNVLVQENEELNSKHSLSNVFEIVRASFDGVINFLEVEIMPNITIGTLMFIPVVLGVIFFILKALVL